MRDEADRLGPQQQARKRFGIDQRARARIKARDRAFRHP